MTDSPAVREFERIVHLLELDTAGRDEWVLTTEELMRVYKAVCGRWVQYPLRAPRRNSLVSAP
jgi:hypothetical protein